MYHLRLKGEHYQMGVKRGTIFPFLSARRILQLEAIGNSISNEIAVSVSSAFSNKYLTIKHELKPGLIFSSLVITKVIATAKPWKRK